MDCRNSLVLGLCLLGTGAGCVSQQPMVPGGSAANMMGMDPRVVRDSRPPKPNAEMCVAYGRMCERKASLQGIGPQQQQALRDEARKSYQRAMVVEPSSRDGYMALTEYYLADEDLERAIASCRKGLRKLPNDAVLWSELGFCQCRLKNWNEAIVSFGKAHELDPERREFGTELGLCLARAGRVEESVACLSKVQGPAQAHYNVARMLERLDQMELSKQHLRRSLELKPDLEPAQQMLARLEAPGPAGDRAVAQIGFEQTPLTK